MKNTKMDAQHKMEKNMKSSKGKLGKQAGIALLELMIAFTIIGIAAAGLYAMAAGIKGDAAQQDFVRLHRELINNVQAFYAPDYLYTGITTQGMVDSKIVPKIMRRGSGSTASIQPPYGSATGSLLEDSSRTDLWAIQYVGMPADSCAQDVASTLESSLRIEAGAAAGSLTVVKDLTASPAVPANKAALATLCGSLSGTYTLKTTQR